MAVEVGRLASRRSSSPAPFDVTTMAGADGRIERITLRERAIGRAPVVDIVDLRRELADGNRSLLSAALATALANLDTDAGDRAILVLDRRGTASIVLCRDCGYVQVCPECQRPLVFHATGMALRCHHCGATAPACHTPCPPAGLPGSRYLGGGTERARARGR